MLHSPQVTEPKDIDKTAEQKLIDIFSHYEQKYQEIINLLPKNREDTLKQTDNEKKANLEAAKQIYHDVFGKKEDPYVQYFRLKLNQNVKLDLNIHFRDGSSHYDYKKLLKQNSAISLLNYGLAITNNTTCSRYQHRAISCFVMVLLLENNIQSVLSKEALKQLTNIKEQNYVTARAAFYRDLFQSPNNMEKNTFYKDYLYSNGNDRYIIEFFDKVSPSKKVSKVMPDAMRIELLALLDAKRKEFFDKEKQADKTVDNKQVDTKMVETKEGVPISTLPAQSIFAPSHLSDRQQATPNLSDTKQQLKSKINQKETQILNKEEQILILQKDLLKMQTDLLELKSKLHELKNPPQEFPTQELRKSTTHAK